MYSLQFWKHWSKSFQFLFWFLSICCLLALGLFWFNYFLWPAPAIAYDHYQQLQNVEVASHSFSVGIINLAVPADVYLVFENIFGSQLRPAVFASYFLLTALTVAFLFFISIATVLSRFRFLMAMTIVILFITTLQFDSLEIFGLTNHIITLAVVLLYGALAFYFHAIKTYYSFVQRLLAFLLLTLVIGVVVFCFAKITSPFLHIAANGLLASIIVSLIFIIIVAHEIVAAFVSVITKGFRSQKSLQHFLILTAIYLVNVFLMIAAKKHLFDWSFYTVSPFFLITVSAIIGIWGFRQKEAAHENILNNEPLRIYFFLSLALVSLSALFYFTSSASDMMMDTLEDIIMAAHFACGLIFTVYVFANFAPMLMKNLQVHKVLYKPETLPLFTTRILSLVATFAMLSWATSWKTYLNETVATYLHAQGDVYVYKNDDASAEKYYLKSLQFRNQNLHAHYALANIYENRNESIKAREQYEKAIEWTPSVPLYLNLSRSFSQRGDVLEAALTIDDGKKNFPNNGELLNASALSFLKLKVADSALYFFQQAKNINATKEIAETNLLAASTMYNANLLVDSVISLGKINNATKANELALATSKNKKVVIEGKIVSDTSLSIYEAVALCNYLVNQKETVDTTEIRNAIALAKKEVNDFSSEQLLISSAHALYAQGYVKEALQLAREVAATSGNGNYFSLMGLWLLEQNNPWLARVYFNQAFDHKHSLAPYHRAIAELESDSLNYAYASCDSLKKSDNKKLAAFAGLMIRVLTTKSNEVNALTDEEKYFYCRYIISLTDKTQFENTIHSITNEQLRVQAIIDRSKKWFAMDEPIDAENQVNQINTSYDRNINQQVANLRLMIAVEKNDWKFVNENFSKIELTPSHKKYIEALLAQQNGNQKLAEQKFNELIKADNQFEGGIVAASRFFPNDMNHFSVLADGLSVKPNSVKILKQHALFAMSLNLYDAAQESLDKLRAILPDASFKKFVAAHPDYFGAEKK